MNRGVLGFENRRNVKGVERVLKAPFGPFEGRTKYHVKVLAPFKVTVQRIALLINSLFASQFVTHGHLQ